MTEATAKVREQETKQTAINEAAAKKEQEAKAARDAAERAEREDKENAEREKRETEEKARIEAEEAAKIKAERKIPTLLPERIGLAEFKRRDWVVSVPMDVLPEDIIDPGYWAHVCAEFKPLDTLEVRWEDGSLIHNLRVLWCEKTYANVKLVSIEKLGTIVPAADLESKRFIAEWKGHLKWTVLRKADRQIVASRFHDRVQAAAWIADNDKV